MLFSGSARPRLGILKYERPAFIGDVNREEGTLHRRLTKTGFNEVEMILSSKTPAP